MSTTAEQVEQETNATENTSALRQECYKAIKKIESIERDRSDLNADINLVKTQLEAMGVSKKAVSLIMQVTKMDSDQLAAFDTAYLLLRKAIGLPLQPDLFD